MRRIQLWVVSFGMFIFFPLDSFSSDNLTSEQTVIIKINELSQDLNVEIYRFFMNHSDVKVINSCQELGLVVFKFVGSGQLGNQAVSHIVSSILKDQFSVDQVEVKSNYSQNDVNVDCRAKKQSLLGQ